MAEENWLVLPNWLDQQFLQKALKDHYQRGSLTFSDYDIRPATNKGDNYLSQMFRVKATLKSNEDNDEEISIVVKSLPHGEKAEKFIVDTQFFVLETIMFTKALPSLGKILKKCKLPQLFASLYYQQGPPHDLLILEDLQQDGFCTADRIRGLDLDHCILVVESIAAYHAASLVVLEENPELKKLKTGWVKENSCRNEPWIKAGIEELIKAIQKWDNVPKDWVKKLNAFKEAFPEKLYTNCDPNQAEVNVLNHGDLWTANIMFKYQNSVPIALKFVDFQISCYCSPVLDLLFFIFSSPQNYVRENHVHLLLERYQKRFEEICRKIDCPVQISLRHLEELFAQKIIFGFIISVTVFPITKAKREDVRDFNDVLSDGAIGVNTDYFQSSIFEAGMRSMLPIFEQNGLFD